MKNSINISDRALFLYTSRNELELKNACERAIRELLDPEDFINICKIYKITSNEFVNMLSNKILHKISNPTVLYSEGEFYEKRTTN